MATQLRTVISRLQKLAPTLVAGAIAVAASSCGPPPPELTVTMRFQYGCRADSTCPSGGVLLTGSQNDGTPPLSLSCLMDRTTTPGTVRFLLRAHRGPLGSSVDNAREGIVLCGEVPAGTTGGGVAAQNSKFDMYISGTNVLGQNGTTCPITVNGLTSDSIEGQFKCENAGDNSTPPRPFYVSGTTDSQNMTASPELGEFQFTTCRNGVITRCM